MSQELMEKPKQARLRASDPFDLFEELQGDFSRLWASPWSLLAGYPLRQTI